MLARVVMLVSLVGLVISACGGIVPINAPDVRPVIDPSPVSVTIHYDESLRNHHCTGDMGYISFSWTFALGPPSIEMFNPIFATLFKDVDFPNDHYESESSSEKREIIELHLTEFTGCQASWPILGTTVVEIAYEATVRSSDGEELVRWSGRGRAGPEDDRGGYDGSSAQVELAYLSALTGVAMRKAAADFVVNYENDPEVRSWAER